MEARANEARIEWKERPIVHVEGTVMMRGELGFTPYLGFGSSRVAIYESVPRTEYLLYGYKIQDKKVTLDDLIPLKMPFTFASPIFHHWIIGNKKMGLSFNGTADARSFDRGVRVALENLEKAAMNASSSSVSDEPTSASPTSTQSFTLPYSEGSESPGKQPTTTSPVTPRQAPEVLRPPVSDTFRPHTMSASSSKLRPTPPARVQRRHSLSATGRPYRNASTSAQSVSPVRPSCRVELSAATTAQQSSPSSFEFPSKSNDAETKDEDAPPRPTVDTEHNRRPLSTRRHRSRHRSDSHRPRRTKTPNLDNLERQRDLHPTKPNSYVQFASSGTRSVTSRSVTGIPLTGRGFRTKDDNYFSYTTRTVPQRPDGGCSPDYVYRGLKSSESDLFGKQLFHCNPSFNSVSDPRYILKQPSLHKGNDFSKRGSGKYEEDLSERSRCKNCQIMFNLDRNRPGLCAEAPPDNCEQCMKYTTCLPVAQRVFYHCFRGTESKQDEEPCSCSRYTTGPRLHRWLLLGLISIFFPCLCLYPLLKSCHRCGVACHCCGGRHEAKAPVEKSPGHRTNRC